MVPLRTLVTSDILRSSAIWQSGSTRITAPDKELRRLSETSSSRKSGTRLSASIKEFRPLASRLRDHLRRRDRAISLLAASRLGQWRRMQRLATSPSRPAHEIADIATTTSAARPACRTRDRNLNRLMTPATINYPGLVGPVRYSRCGGACSRPSAALLDSLARECPPAPAVSGAAS